MTNIIFQARSFVQICDMLMPKEFIEKHNRSLPRYTSYPTVPNWKDSDQKTDKSLLNNSIDLSKVTSLYIHLPYCESLCTYCGCNKWISKTHAVEDPYVGLIQKEWSLRIGSTTDIPLENLHLGGGTPTFFSPHNLKKMIEPIKERSQRTADSEWSFEGHPSNTRLDHFETLKTLGFDRVSFGIQDFNEKIQKAIHRHQTIDEIENVVQNARKTGFNSVNFDLVYGLPFQNLKHLNETLQKITLFWPERIALYSYAHVPWKSKSQRLYDENDLPSAFEKYEMFISAKEFLIQNGYINIGLDHFVLPSDNMAKKFKEHKLQRTFMGYTTQNTPQLIGLGVSSISTSSEYYFQNTIKLDEYKKKIATGSLTFSKFKMLSSDDKTRSHIIQEIMINGRIPLDENQLSLLCDDSIEELNQFIKEGILTFESNFLKMNPNYLFLSRNVASLFDDYLKDKKAVFSMSI